MWIWTRPALLLGTSFFATVVQGSPALPPPPDSTSLQPAPPLPSPLPDDQCNIGDIVKRADNLTLPSVASNGVHSYANTTEFSIQVRQMPVYNIDCTVYPNVCENWCYYSFCKNGGLNTPIVTVDRLANLRSQSECRSTNRCSSTCTPRDGWVMNPQSGLTCDEQPKNTNTEGGANAATRCVPRSENASEGSVWGNFINGNGGSPFLPDGTQVEVVLNNPSPAGFCGMTNCLPPAMPPGIADAVRQR